MNSWSVSSVKGFWTCPLQWFLRRQGVREDARALPLVEGIVLHEVLSFHMQGLRDGKTPEESECIELLDAELFTQEMQGEIRYGAKTREDVRARLAALYSHWRANARLEGEVVAVEQELKVQFPFLPLPAVAYPDLVLRTPRGIELVDFKVTGSRPGISGSDAIEDLDLQKIVYVRAYQLAHGESPVSWRWQYLVKTKAPQTIDVASHIASEGADTDLSRIRAVVEPSLPLMEAVETGRSAPVPSPSYFAPCDSCGYRMACARWTGAVAQDEAAATQPSAARP